MAKVKISYSELSRLVEIYEDKAFRIEKAASIFLRKENKSEAIEIGIKRLRLEGEKFNRLVWVCRKYKRSQKESFSSAADELCQTARKLRTDVWGVEQRFYEELKQKQRKEDKISAKRDKREMGGMKKFACIAGTPISFVTIHHMLTVANSPRDLVICGVIVGTAIAYNHSIEMNIRKAVKAINKNMREKGSVKPKCSRPNFNKKGGSRRSKITEERVSNG